MRRAGKLCCDMHESCTALVTHVDESGFVYCAAHGTARRAWKRCRQLRAHEIRRLERGEVLTRY